MERGLGFRPERGGVSDRKGAWPVISQLSYWLTMSHGAGLRATQAWLEQKRGKGVGPLTGKGRGFQPERGTASENSVLLLAHREPQGGT